MKVSAFSVGLWVAALGIALSVVSCSPAGKFGAPIGASEETAINDVLDDPSDFVGKTVILKGQIQTVDDDGKGFSLDNGLGSVMHVKVAGDFTIAKGAKYRLTTAEGKVELDKTTNEPRLLAVGVEVE